MAICVGNAVAWLLALYTEGGMWRLLWNVAFAVAAALLIAFATTWAGLPLPSAWVLFLGPPASLLAIACGHAARRAIRRKLDAARAGDGGGL